MHCVLGDQCVRRVDPVDGVLRPWITGLFSTLDLVQEVFAHQFSSTPAAPAKPGSEVTISAPGSPSDARIPSACSSCGEATSIDPSKDFAPELFLQTRAHLAAENGTVDAVPPAAPRV